MSVPSSRQYDALARFLVALAKIRGGPAPDDLCIHKRLLTGPQGSATSVPSGGKAATNEWLARKIASTDPERVLDVGCGFGTLAAAISEASPASVSGINASGFAITFGQKFWAGRRPGRTPGLHSAAIGDPPEGGPFDAVVAVESLSYTDDLAHTFAWLDAICTDGARIWVLDDWVVPGVPKRDPDLLAVCEHWRRSAFYSRDEIIAAAAAHRFSVHDSTDLTHLVPASHEAPGLSRRRTLRAATWLFGTSSAGEIAHAFLGGWHLENLYARGLCRYDLIELKRGPREF